MLSKTVWFCGEKGRESGRLVRRRREGWDKALPMARLQGSQHPPSAVSSKVFSRKRRACFFRNDASAQVSRTEFRRRPVAAVQTERVAW